MINLMLSICSKECHTWPSFITLCVHSLIWESVFVHAVCTWYSLRHWGSAVTGAGSCSGRIWYLGTISFSRLKSPLGSRPSLAHLHYPERRGPWSRICGCGTASGSTECAVWSAHSRSWVAGVDWVGCGVPPSPESFPSKTPFPLWFSNLSTIHSFQKF